MSDLIFCQSCGKKFERSAEQCPHCGFSRRNAIRYKSKGTAGALALLLGGLGTHRFYLGQWWGILYLLLVWTFVPMLVALVEGIVFLCTNQENWDRKYNEGVSQETSSSSTLIVVVVCVFAGVAMLGILAAIAIPAYQDYTIRAKVAESLAYASAAQAAVMEHTERTGRKPSTFQEAGFSESGSKDVESLEWDENDSAIVVTMGGSTAIYGKKFALELIEQDGQKSWRCVSINMQEKYLPRRCRNTGG